MKKILFFLIPFFCFISCDNQSNSKQNQGQANYPSRPIKSEEQMKAEQLKYDTEYAQVKKKVETKISKLSYKAIESPRIILFQGGAETHTAVKKSTPRYNSVTNTFSEELGDKVFTLDIQFKKYTEYEIASVRLVDESNMIYWDLE